MCDLKNTVTEWRFSPSVLAQLRWMTLCLQGQSRSFVQSPFISVEGQEAGAPWSLLLFYMSKDKSVQAAKINKGPGPVCSLHSHQKKMPSLPFTDLLSCFLEKKNRCNTSSFPDQDAVRILISSAQNTVQSPWMTDVMYLLCYITP